MSLDVGDFTWARGCNLDDTARKARFGISYVGSLCAQAGWTAQETPVDSDREAIDLNLKHHRGIVSVQVKCGTKGLGKHHLTVPLDPGWITKWDRQAHPVYLVYVSVARDPRHWTKHPVQMTTISGHAYWVRVDRQGLGKSVQVPLANRLTADTLEAWYDDWCDGFGKVQAS